jgi:ribosomal protein L40E
MARVTCRCGEVLRFTSSDPERLICPRCGAKIRLRRSPTHQNGSDRQSDGYVRFHCPCGRRLKVQTIGRPEAGKCPDCGRVVPVPTSAWEQSSDSNDPIDQPRPGRVELMARTIDLDPADLERLAHWSNEHPLRSRQNVGSARESQNTPNQALEAQSTTPPRIENGSSPPQVEAGLRVCSRCGSPLHMSATACRFCQEPAPARR